MSKRVQPDDAAAAAALSNRQPRSSTISSTGSNRAPARVTGDVVSVDTTNWIGLVRENKLLVDKTHLLLDVMDDSNSDVIFRSRCFGKTIFLNMAHDFFNVAETEEELAERKRIFEEMNIHKVDPTFVDKHCGRYPVIHLNLKDVRPVTLDNLRDSMEEVVSTAIDEWGHAISDTSKAELNFTRGRLNRKIDNMHSSIDDSVAIPKELVGYLSRYYNEKCIVLVDEFDVPVVSAPEGIREEVKRYMCELLSPLAKDNKNVCKFIMVGIDPINLNTFGPGMERCKRYPLHEDSDRSREGASSYQFAFGFTEEEVGALIDNVADKMGLAEGQADQLRRVARKWYGGYHACKGVRLYNPWSIMNYIRHIARSKENCLEAVESGSVSRYWLVTDDKASLARNFRRAGGIEKLLPVIRDLVVDFRNLVDATDGPVPNYVPRVRVRIEDFVPATKSLGDVGGLPNHITTISGDEQQGVISIASSVQGKPAEGSLSVDEFMTLLYYHGYLSIKDKAYLTIPNYEVLYAWLELIEIDRLADRLISGMDGQTVLIDLLLSGEYPEFIKHVKRVLEAQGQGIAAETHETFYRMLLSLTLSLFLDSSKYDIAREVSINQGRPAIVVKPRRGVADNGSGRRPVGVLIEVKRADPDTVDGEAHSLTVDDTMFIEDESKDRTERVRRKLGKKTFGYLKRLLAKGYKQILKKKYLATFNGCCDEVLVIVISFSSKHCLFQFEYFKRQAGGWYLDTKSHPVVDDLACPNNWPDL
ncbi:hypothetical protein EV182_000305 [Spiromyces aspiralis]|uniref:Uncharacterized protein n=1 Tax=Spiromyces aspiralis TaxID=68401 RepID=A0ACC1HV17_9FUNG|nr:hypothetical protein EV182_000305 [Spiromyces aspiralis]